MVILNITLLSDYSLWIQMFNDGVKFANVNEFLFKYRDFKNSFSKSKADLMSKERVELSKKFINKHKTNIKNAIDF